MKKKLVDKNFSKAAAGTFALNKNEAIHGWYSYLEGYSSPLIESIIHDIGVDNIHSIFDPFCGTGTTSLVASSYGIKSYYCETNPFMQLVIEAKINCVKRLRDSSIRGSLLKEFLRRIKNYIYQTRLCKITWGGFEKFFETDVLFQLLDMKKEVDRISDSDTRTIALVLLASVTVKASKMVRQGDLRFAKNGEKTEADMDVVKNFIDKLEIAIEDIDSDSYRTQEETICLSEDARDIDIESMFDCVITSPPYLNGTNYIRNTKLELMLSNCITSEADLPVLHAKGIIAGINNVSKRKRDIEVLEVVSPFIKQLEPVAYDKRIPVMVAGYFYDMKKVVEKLACAIKNEGYFIMDIGDSQFAGVHIPTHDILIEICKSCGFELYDNEILRERRSKNGMVLTQRLLKFRLRKQTSLYDVFLAQSQAFMNSMPYKQPPYSSRNWGHPWHSLCSYHGKLKPAIAHFLVQQFTEPGDVIVDPLCGVGTIPLEARLQGRIGIGNDLSELAYIVTKAKVEKVNLHECHEVLQKLSLFIGKMKYDDEISLDIRKYMDFGFNGKLSSYFHEETYREILCARRFFLNKLMNLSVAEAMVFSCLLHVLHGNRPYALSRNSHPLTPYAPTGEYIYKNLIYHVENKMTTSLVKGNFEKLPTGYAIFGDYLNLSKSDIKADAIISSPPFADSIKFYMQNWMRLWLCGWESEDYKNAENLFLDQKQRKDFDIYNSFFQTCFNILKPNGKVILHLGKTNKVDMAEELAKRAYDYFSEVFRCGENVQRIEKHGVKDKGGTVEHQYLFLMKR